MTPKIAGTGHSFRGAFQYYLHDKRADSSDPHPTTANRVEWTETRNLATDNPQMAWRIMRATHAEADELKQAAGVRNTGQKLKDGPVFSYSLAWEPDAAATLTREEMTAFADRTIEALGASHLQAVIVCHNDTAHPHVHVILNRIDPATGKAHTFGQSKNKLSDLTARYERERGQIVTPKRQRAAEAREEARQRPKAEHGPNASWAKRRRAEKALHQTEARKAERTAKSPLSELALSALTRDRSTFTRHDLARLVARHTDSAEEFQAVLARLEASHELVSVGLDERGRERFTTREHQALEQRLMTHADTLRHRAGAEVRPLQPKNLTLSEDQNAALRHVVGPERLALIVGVAGTGKSTMAGAAKRSWEADGLTVRGMALSGIAADSLKAGSGIESRTIHSQLLQWERGEALPTRKDVLVVDEAGMIGSRQMERILHFAEQGRAKVVLIGDPEQLQAIEAGGAFRVLADRFGATEINTVRRQQETWQQDATRELAAAATAAAVTRYEDAGMVHEHKTQDDAKAALIAAWREEAAAQPRSSQIILAYTRADVRDLNDRARATRREAGELGPDQELLTATGRRDFATGDRIYFLRNDAGLGVRNGSLATIERIERQTVTARLDGEDRRQVVFSLESYNQIDHGYAATIHKSQGVTVDRAHLLASRNLDRHSTYVAMSRHRDRVDVHWSGETFENRVALVRRLGRAAVKDTSLDYDRADSSPQRPERLAATQAGAAVRQLAEQLDTSAKRLTDRPLAPASKSAAALKAHGDQQMARHAEERSKLWPDHQALRAAIYDAARAEIRSSLATTKAENRAASAEQSRRQKDERSAFEQREQHLTGVVWNAVRLATSRQIPGDGSNAGILSVAFACLSSGNARREAFDTSQRHESERLAATFKAHTDLQIGQIKEARDRQLAEARAAFDRHKADLSKRQGIEIADVRAQWKAIYTERERVARDDTRDRQAVRMQTKTARRDTRAAWSNESTKRAEVAARYSEARADRAAAQQESQAVKYDHDRARDPKPVPPPVPNKTVSLARPTPAPSPAGEVPAVHRKPAQVPAVDKDAAYKQAGLAPPAPRPAQEFRVAVRPKPPTPDPAPRPAFEQAARPTPLQPSPKPEQAPAWPRMNAGLPIAPARPATPEKAQTPPTTPPRPAQEQPRRFDWKNVDRKPTPAPAAEQKRPEQAPQRAPERPPVPRPTPVQAQPPQPVPERPQRFDWTKRAERPPERVPEPAKPEPTRQPESQPQQPRRFDWDKAAERAPEQAREQTRTPDLKRDFNRE